MGRRPQQEKDADCSKQVVPFLRHACGPSCYRLHCPPRPRFFPDGRSSSCQQPGRPPGRRPGASRWGNGVQRVAFRRVRHLGPGRHPQPAAQRLGHRLAPPVLHRSRRGRPVPARQRVRSRQRRSTSARLEDLREQAVEYCERHLDFNIPDEGRGGDPGPRPVAGRLAEGQAARLRLHRAQGHARPSPPGGPRTVEQAAGQRRPDLPPGRGEGAAHGRGDEGRRAAASPSSSGAANTRTA